MVPNISSGQGQLLSWYRWFKSSRQFDITIIPAANFVEVIIIGAASGLTATGTNQMFKQFNKDKEK